MSRRADPPRTPFRQMLRRRDHNILAGLQAGLSLRQLADQFGISKSRVHEIGHRMGFTPGRPPRG